MRLSDAAGIKNSLLNSRSVYFMLFALSGFSGLIYESIWTRYLKLFLGHAAYAQALVLAIFMGGLAMVLASVRGFDRRRYIELAEALHPGISQPEVFELWLQRSPLRPARFVPMLRHWRSHAT